MKTLFILFVALICNAKSATSQYIFIGPTYHYNIGGGLRNSSLGIEISYWHWDNNSVAMGADIGFEISKDKKRVYSELQTGLLVGGSLGYVHEFSEGKSIGGFQISGWTAFFGGIEIRYRKVDEINYFAPGAFIKLPLTKMKLKFDIAPSNMFGNLM